MSAPPRTLGPYEIVRRLGIGGMGETFLAVRRGPGGFEQRVCLKRVLPEHEGDETFVRFFMEEARIAASLRHSNIVGVVDFGAAAGADVLALERSAGADLGQILRRTPGGRLPPPLVALIGADLAHGLEYAHGRTRAGESSGILHRDLSASNVLVSYAGEVKLSDFGLAKVMTAGNATSSGTVRGKVPYMSPEQARADRMAARSDLFSLGIILHEALTGARPFDGDTFGETMARILNGRRPPLAELAQAAPEGLVRVVDQLLEVDPARRLPSAAALVDALAPLTPAPSARRELGAIAQRARPKQTIGMTPVADAEPLPHATPAKSLAQAPVSAPSTASMLARGVALGLVIAAIGAAAIFGIRAWRTAPGPAATAAPVAAPPSAPAPVVPVASPAVPDPTAPAPAPSPSPAPPALPDPAPPTPGPAPTDTSPTPATPAEPPAPTPESERAVVTVAAVPWGKVWIDGRLVGNAPVRATLAPGAHTIAASTGDTPTKRTTIRVSAGERRSVTLRLQ